ncbi:BMP family protein [Kosmotoga sp. DU53]|uniref:BMP family lipoprotein n=1 Tax=Kosmotoga sp. DU53 TaxID=1310160 RepID=UPI0007C48681|nr:BMP family ABC transporter substrate-binding protein [Kosmotoga sp. DU53]MDK2801185.1 basic rane protein [Clostridiales bacterium]OAA22628.1 hypothetical protein DU53_03710 [Kosmotoga sp. DU53]
MKRTFVVITLLMLTALTFGTLKVAIVAGDAIGDRGFTDMAYIGIKNAAKVFDIKYKIFECHVDSSKYYDALKAAAKRYDLIFVDPGYFFDKELKEISREYPKKTFVYIDGVSNLPNVVSVPFKQNEGAFLAGCLAAMLTDKTALRMINEELIVGFVGGFDMPVIRDYQLGFEQGVKYVNPSVKVIARYAGTHYDPSLGKETAYSVFKEGADVIFQAAGPTGLGVLEAAKDYKFYAIGVDTDQGYLQPGYIVSSMLKRVDVAVFNIVKLAIEGKLQKGSIHVYGVANGGIGLAYNQQMLDIVPASVYLKIKEIENKLKNREIVVDTYLK